MSALIIRLPEEKRTRLKLVAKSRKVSVTKLIEEMATILLADFDAETRFELRAARGRGRVAQGLALLDKAAGKRARSKRDRRQKKCTGHDRSRSRRPRSPEKHHDEPKNTTP
jgi:hypothetical protein